MDPHFWTALAGILWIDLILSGDNALVIAVIAEGLPERQKRWAMILGTAMAAALRIGGAFVASIIMGWKGLSLAIGIYLLYVAVKLVLHEDEGSGKASKGSLFAAVLAIALADIGMSLDNVFAVAALAHGDTLLMGIGIAMSVVLMMVGAALISMIIGKFPILKWFGSAFLGWIAGGIIMHDPIMKFEGHMEHAGLFASVMAAGFVLLLGSMLSIVQKSEKTA